MYVVIVDIVVAVKYAVREKNAARNQTHIAVKLMKPAVTARVVIRQLRIVVMISAEKVTVIVAEKIELVVTARVVIRQLRSVVMT